MSRPTDEVRSAVPETADPRWFREPTPRERATAAALFIGFGLFFVVLFVVLSGSWFRWVVLGLGAVSILHGLWHAVESRPAKRAPADEAAATHGPAPADADQQSP